MAVYNKFSQFADDVLEAKHNFVSNVFKVMLTNTAPVATNSIRADISEIAAGGGYVPGGATVAVTLSLLGGVAKVTGTTATFTATGAGFGPFRYAVLYNSTFATQPLISWWDYGVPVTLADTEQFAVRFDAGNGIFQLS